MNELQDMIVKKDTASNVYSSSVQHPVRGRPTLQDKPLPPNYVCHRCKQGGHFIQHCPTNNDARFNTKKTNSVTGIPKAFLQHVQKSSIPTGQGDDDDDDAMANMRQMLGLEDADGSAEDTLVPVGMANSAAWSMHRPVFESETTEQGSGNTSAAASSVPVEYQCSLCKACLRQATMTPCCFTKFCGKLSQGSCQHACRLNA
jgi:hypothetical protein